MAFKPSRVARAISSLFNPVLYPGVFPNLAAYTKPRADLKAILELPEGADREAIALASLAELVLRTPDVRHLDAAFQAGAIRIGRIATDKRCDR